MQSGPFEWTLGTFKSSVRVEFSDTAMTVSSKAGVKSINYSEVEKVYYNLEMSSHKTHMLSLQIKTTDKRWGQLLVTGFRSPLDHNFEQEKGAIRTFLWHYDNTQHKKKVFDGARPSYIGYLLLLAAAVLYACQVWLYGDAQSLMRVVIVFSLLFFFAAYLTVRFRKLNRPSEISVQSVLDQLDDS